MTRSRGRFLFSLLLCLCFAAPALAEIRATSAVNRTRLRIGENLTYTIRVEGVSAIPQPALPPIEGFQAKGSYQTVENTPGGRVLLFHYLLTPTRGGTIDVPGIPIRIQDQWFTLAGFRAKVEEETSLSVPSVPLGGDIDAEDLILRGRLSKNRITVGEPVVYSLHLLARPPVRNVKMIRRPDFSGFQRVEDPRAHHTPSRQTRVGDAIYLDLVLLRYVLFPLVPGKQAVEATEVEIKVQTSAIPSRTVRVPLAGGGVSLTVDPLPPPPPGFAGAVGRFKLAMTSDPIESADLDTPFTLDFEVEVSGFLPQDPFAWPETPLFRRYPPKVEDESAFSGGKYLVRRRVTLSFLPLVQGRAELPPVLLHYFDPRKQEYAVLSAGEMVLKVRKGDGGRAGTDVEIMPIVSLPEPGDRPGGDFRRARFFLLFLLPYGLTALLGGGLTAHRRFFQDPRLARVRKLRQAIRRELTRAKRNLDARKHSVFHEHLQGALAAKLELLAGRPVVGLARPRLRAVLSGLGMEPAKVKSIMDLLEEIETARYAPGRPTLSHLERRIANVRRLVSEGSPAAKNGEETP